MTSKVKRYVVGLVGMLLFTACWSSSKEKADSEFIRTLKDDGKTVYIPNLGDIALWRDSTYVVTDEGMPKPGTGRAELSKAILDSVEISMQTIEKLLESPYPNVQVYGYIYYVRNTNDLNYEYLKQAIPKKDTIFYSDWNALIADWCYASDVMLTIAFKGVNYAYLLPAHRNYLYGLTDEQKHELYRLYKERGSISEWLDREIQEGYENDKTFLNYFNND